MHSPKRIVVVAGEESGDIHAASFIKKLKNKNPQLHISGIGGKHMQAAGANVINNLASHGVTGLSEVVRHFRVIKKAFHDIKNHLSDTKPDLLVLVDYPGFNLRLAKFAKRELGIKIVYYISPQIWAWKANRINKIRLYIDQMAVILPFEKAIYEKAKVPVAFVGHPLANTLNDKKESIVKSHTNKKIIALLPGSRVQEIEKHLPIMLKSAQRLSRKNSDLHFIIPVASSINPEFILNFSKQYSIPITIVLGKAIDVMQDANLVIVASGTASLECALLKKPMCIIYKVSFITYLAALKVIKVKYLGLCNLLLNKMVVPELLQYDCNVEELTKIVSKLLHDESYISQLKQQLEQLNQSLSINAADCDIASIIEDNIN